ncbi:MAG: hypothetical protein HYZ81_25705 [Nitrospinae bacterium]|nr:hypothetical protein [Nitrospinota bacterium]
MSISSIASEVGGGAAAISPSQSGNRPDPRKQQEIQELRQRDAEVKAHEAAHLAAAGPYARGGAHYDYVVGSDGQRYAVGGEVSIDLSKVPDDPEATIQKAETIKRAALAPANPSAQDRRIAAEADRMALEAQQELAKKRAEEMQGYDRNAGVAAGAAAPATIDLVI